MSSKRYELHIITDSYAGNFERELFSYATGVTDTTERSPELAELAIQEENWPEYESPFEDYLDYIIGTDEQMSPNYITIDSDGTRQKPPNEQYIESNIVLIALCEPLPIKLMKILRKRAKQYCQEHKIEIKQFKLYEFIETKREIPLTDCDQ